MSNSGKAGAEHLRKEIGFLTRLLGSANTVDEYVAAARASAKLAARATKELQAAAAAREAVITVRNVPTLWNWMKMKELLDQLGIKVMRVDKGPDWDKAILTISDASHQAAIIDKLSGYKVEGVALTAVAGAPSAVEMSELRLLAHKSKRALDAATGIAAKMQRSHERAQVLAGACRPPSNVCSVVCPWFDRPYPAQLEAKKQRLQEVLAATSAEVAKRRGDAPSSWPLWLQALQQPQGNECSQGSQAWQPCAPVVGVVRSPALTGYRNRSDMAIGLDMSEKTVEVGFFLGATVDGITAVADPEPSLHTSATAKAYAHIVRTFVNQSHLPAWDKRRNPSNGFWRMLTVREAPAHTPLFTGLPSLTPCLADLDLDRYMTLSGAHQAQTASTSMLEEVLQPSPDEVVLIVQVNHEFTDATVMKSELQSLVEHVRKEAAAQHLPLTALLVQCHSALSHTATADAVLLPMVVQHGGGEGQQVVMQEAICEVNFRIQPLNLFQVNTGAACLMCKLIADWLASYVPTTNTLLLDLYCGVGLFGLTLASRFTHVIGLDSSEAVVADASATAAHNSISNSQFIAGKAEEVLGQLLSTHVPAYEAVVAVLDPPRGGLHPAAVQQLLACTKLKRVAYVSCNLDTLAINLADLCGGPRPLKQGGRSRQRESINSGTHSGGVYFWPVQAAAVDMFPQTAQFHAVVQLERD